VGIGGVIATRVRSGEDKVRLRGGRVSRPEDRAVRARALIWKRRTQIAGNIPDIVMGRFRIPELLL
jgi:hypothetical protein